MTCPFGFLVVLPDQMIMIPVDSHFSWLTMFYIRQGTVRQGTVPCLAVSDFMF